NLLGKNRVEGRVDRRCDPLTHDLEAQLGRANSNGLTQRADGDREADGCLPLALFGDRPLGLGPAMLAAATVAVFLHNADGGADFLRPTSTLLTDAGSFALLVSGNTVAHSTRACSLGAALLVALAVVFAFNLALRDRG